MGAKRSLNTREFTLVNKQVASPFLVDEATGSGLDSAQRGFCDSFGGLGGLGFLTVSAEGHDGGREGAHIPCRRQRL